METGQKYKEEIIRMKQQLLNSQYVGTYQGDRNIEDAENDPNIILGEDEAVQDQMQQSYGQSKLNQLFQMMKNSQNKTDKVI